MINIITMMTLMNIPMLRLAQQASSSNGSNRTTVEKISSLTRCTGMTLTHRRYDHDDFFWYAHTYSTIMTYTMRMVMVMAATYHHHGERYLLYLFNE